MNRAFFSLERFAPICLLVFAAASPVVAQQQDGKTAGQVYKNLHVLQDVPFDQFNPTMRMIAGSLGVECDFCHVKDRSQDDRPTKRMARTMMTMVLALNKNTFGGQTMVSCYTCHRGKSEPVTTTAIPEVNNILITPPIARSEEVSKPALPTVDQILAKYVEALGGDNALHKVTTRMITATDDVPTGEGGLGPGTHAEAEYYYKAPNARAEFVHMPNGVTAAGFDGSTGWTQDARGGVHNEPAPAKRDYAFYNNHYSDFFENRDLKKEYSQLQVRGVEKVRGHEAYMVVGTRRGRQSSKALFRYADRSACSQMDGQANDVWLQPCRGGLRRLSRRRRRRKDALLDEDGRHVPVPAMDRSRGQGFSRRTHRCEQVREACIEVIVLVSLGRRAEATGPLSSCSHITGRRFRSHSATGDDFVAAENSRLPKRPNWFQQGRSICLKQKLLKLWHFANRP